MVEEIKNSVAGNCNGYQPETLFKTKYGKEQEGAGDENFSRDRTLRSRYRGKQHIVVGDDDEHGRIKGAITLKAGGSGKTSHRRR